ncbi:MAG: VTT domain-containing protein [Promethearchaeota archaeon]
MQDLYQVLVDLMLQGHLGLFIACLGINLIPFISPSNMVLAGVAALLLPTMSWIEIGVVVALSATLSKVILYYTVRGSRMVMSDSMLAKIEYERERVDKWGALALVLSAGSPVPDDPIVIYTGLTKYNVGKFLIAYYLGKVAVTLAGAFLGYTVGTLFESVPIIIGSIALTAILTGVIFKRRTEEGDDSSVSHSMPKH